MALRTQQVIAFESGVTDTVDPLAGSYFVETLTNEVESAALAYISRIDALGGAVAAIECGFMQDEIERAAYGYAKAVESGSEIVVGVNRFVEQEASEPEVFPIDPALQRGQIERLKALRASRDQVGVDAAIDDVRAAARGTQNLLVPMREALKRRATLGEVSDALREVFGEFQPSR